MRALVLTTTLLTVAYAAPPELDPPVTGRKASADAALVVGIERYAALPEASYAERDADAFADFLRDTVGVPRNRMKVLKGRLATRAAIERELGRRAAQVGAGGTLWVYFSGHGSPASDGDAFLIGWEAQPVGDYLADASVRRSLVKRHAQGVPADARAVVVLDSCFSGLDRGGRKVMDVKFAAVTTMAAAPRVAIWSASSGAQFAGPANAARHGLFTYFAIGALSGWADRDRDGAVRLREAERYVQSMMRAALAQTGRSQDPELVAPDDADAWTLASTTSARTGPSLDQAALVLGAATSALSNAGVPALDTGAAIVNSLTDDRGFLFVETDPPGATVVVNGEEVGTSPVQPELMVGRYVVVARLPLHHQARGELRLGVDGARLKLTLPAAYGGVVVESDPPGAEVWLAGAHVGLAPWRDARRASGKYEVELRLADHLSHRGMLVVRDGETTPLKVGMKPNFGGLTVRSEPPGAAIELDGHDTGHTTPHTFPVVKPGAHRVKLTLGGHGQVTKPVTVTREEAASVVVELQAKLGLLTVVSNTEDGKPCAGVVSVDGAARGRAPLKLRLVEGAHDVTVRCGQAEKSERVEVVHNERLSVKVVVRRRAGVEWVRIPGGSFQMGSNEQRDEKPVHLVRVGTFELAKSEVTVAQYGACVTAGKCTAPGTGEYCNWGESGREQQPVNCVDWAQARAFSSWAGGRLPTEAEWEYAARSGGKARKYPWGNEQATCSRAVMDDGGMGCGKRATWPVCSKPSGDSAQGVCDLAGNVCEWVEDVYADSYAGAPTDGSARAGGGSVRVFRGGCWFDTAGNLRAANRVWNAPGSRFVSLGFRPARSSH